MDKKEATKRIAELLAQNDKNIDEAVTLADEHDLEIFFETPDGQSVTYIPQNGKRPTVDDFWQNGYYEAGEGDTPDDWDEQYAGWQNSSTFC